MYLNKTKLIGDVVIMGATFNERESIRRMIDYIVEERSRLWEEYVKAVGRLAKLDEIDREVEKENK